MITLLLLLLTNCFPTWLSRTSTFFYLRPRKPEVHSLPGHGAGATEVVAVKEQVSSFPVRVACSVQRFACCKLQAEEKTPCCSSRPPLRLVVVGRSPFPGDCGNGGWAGPAVYEPQPLLRGLVVLLGFCGASALLFLQLRAALEVSELCGQMCFGSEGSGGVCLSW